MPVISRSSGDTKVKVSLNDISSGHLIDKLVAGVGIAFKVLTAASGEQTILTTVNEYHAGFNSIPAGETLIVAERKNMVSYGIDIEGELAIEGYFVLGV